MLGTNCVAFGPEYVNRLLVAPPQRLRKSFMIWMLGPNGVVGVGPGLVAPPRRLRKFFMMWMLGTHCVLVCVGPAGTRKHTEQQSRLGSRGCEDRLC